VVPLQRRIMADSEHRLEEEEEVMMIIKTAAAIAAAGLRGSFRDHVVLNGIDLRVAEATTFSLLGQSRPGSVTFAAVLQLLLAATFLIMPILVYRYGAEAQAAAEAEVVKQGFPADVLARNNVHFDEGAVGLVLPIVIAICLVVLAVLNLAGNGVGRILSLILQPILLVGGGFITFRQAFAGRFLESAFKNSGDATLAGINVKAFVDAAADAFPAWFLYAVRARFALVTLGSVLVIILLAVPSANTYFR
jgi:hypothetical protein